MILYTTGLTGLKPICQIYEESQTASYISSHINSDSKVNHALDSRQQREIAWTRKGSTVVQADRNMSHAISLLTQNSAPQSPKTTTVKKVAKKQIIDRYKDKWHSHLKSFLKKQGYLTRVMEAENIDFEWKSTIYNLPRNVLKE